MPRFRLNFTLPAAPMLLAASLLAGGCYRSPKIVSYVAPKDSVAVKDELAEAAAGAQRSGGAGQQDPDHDDRPDLSYKAPPDWVLGPKSQVTVVNFMLKGPGGDATVSATPLASFKGKEDAVINMWRQMAGAPPVSSEEAQKELHPIDIAGEQAQLFEVGGSREDKKSRIVTAMLHRPEGTWFFKLQGDDAIVAAQKPAFLDFLKTVKFVPHDHASHEAGGHTGPKAIPQDAPAPTPVPQAVPAPAAANPVATPAPNLVDPSATPAPIVRPPVATPPPQLQATPPPVSNAPAPAPAPQTPAGAPPITSAPPAAAPGSTEPRPADAAPATSTAADAAPAPSPSAP